MGCELVCSPHTVAEVNADDPVCSQASGHSSVSPHATAGVEHDLVSEERRLKGCYPVEELVFIGSPIGVQLVELLPLPAKGLTGPLLLQSYVLGEHPRDATHDGVSVAAACAGQCTGLDIIPISGIRRANQVALASRTHQIVKQPTSACSAFLACTELELPHPVRIRPHDTLVLRLCGRWACITSPKRYRWRVHQSSPIPARLGAARGIVCSGRSRVA